ncbi:MAG: peptidyl-prolyl cis-trans isomerase peptidyl-prolyl cis-trans isomerase [Candidatus Parcubacteria bacterium]|jgi:cyclophilin family peptidyl-prolyl cis-trans isomerase
MKTQRILLASVLALTFVGAGCAPKGDGKVAVPASEAGKEMINASTNDLYGAAALKQQVDADAAAQAKADADAKAAATDKNAATPDDATTKEKPKAGTMQKFERPTKPVGLLPDAEVTNKQIHIKTSKGDIVFELLPKEGPLAASNFVALARSGFYDGLTFHRVIPGFMAQGGDPMGTGYGGPGYQFPDDKVNLKYEPGIVAMANSGPDTNGSQFFIMTASTPLPPSYSIFGRVTSGQSVVDSLKIGDVMTTVTVEDRK